MIEYSYPECTTAVLTGLATFKKKHPDYRARDVKQVPTSFSSRSRHGLEKLTEGGRTQVRHGSCCQVYTRLSTIRRVLVRFMGHLLSVVSCFLLPLFILPFLIILFHFLVGFTVTYATMFALESLSLVGETYSNSGSVRKACHFLLSHQKEDGGWGESWEVRCYISHTPPADSRRSERATD
jgi:lanosterol synthase